MKSRKINIRVNNVSIDLKDYACDFFECLSDEELLDQLQCRGLVENEKPIQDFNKYEFKRFMCDMVGVGYHTPKEQVIEKIKEMM